MVALTWDKSGERKYELGVDHGVLYVANPNGSYSAGVAWNGLTSVTESPDGAEANDIYADNIKYGSIRSAETLGGTIEAYTFPDEFKQCDGGAELENVPGVTIHQQSRAKFGLAYRTKIGNDSSENLGYKLHILYGATASPSEKQYESVNDSPDAITFSWDITTDPIAIEGHPELKATSMLTIDSTTADSVALKKLEDKLFGTDSEEPTLPSPAEVLTIMQKTNNQ